ncbi:Cerebral cavernous malformations protein 2-like protein [Camelus dromedarius]|uniref:Cerebral cavernous malformations protein 2-like protein n=1 Tax=Camelus dromedarius TaxID=9838 RepID=A0A5N4EKM2_CAMDR|nr:Cerebral cavernous malformations protein 2-like protein [Camelus dromedarius]KAB1284002.1 Cerebral cavernous malformations protein 2-like protein [Camelus dromedarius]
MQDYTLHAHAKLSSQEDPAVCLPAARAHRARASGIRFSVNLQQLHGDGRQFPLLSLRPFILAKDSQHFEKFPGDHWVYQVLLIFSGFLLPVIEWKLNSCSVFTFENDIFG